MISQFDSLKDDVVRIGCCLIHCCVFCICVKHCRGGFSFIFSIFLLYIFIFLFICLGGFLLNLYYCAAIVIYIFRTLSVVWKKVFGEKKLATVLQLVV